MGPNALWLIEGLLNALPLKSGMRVLDLGCGRSLTSIFMAREFNVQVWAVDLWITPDHNRKRAEAAGVGHLVFPLRAEAHALPFSHDFFDVIVSIDAYHYFGTDVLYLNYLSRFLRPDGYVGMVVPGLMQPVTEIPEHLARPQSNGKIFGRMNAGVSKRRIGGIHTGVAMATCLLFRWTRSRRDGGIGLISRNCWNDPENLFFRPIPKRSKETREDTSVLFAQLHGALAGLA